MAAHGAKKKIQKPFQREVGSTNEAPRLSIRNTLFVHYCILKRQQVVVLQGFLLDCLGRLQGDLCIVHALLYARVTSFSAFLLQ